LKLGPGEETFGAGLPREDLRFRAQRFGSWNQEQSRRLLPGRPIQKLDFYASLLAKSLHNRAGLAFLAPQFDFGPVVTQSRNLGLLGSVGLKSRADQRKKCDENRTHRESNDDLTNGRNVCAFTPDEVFGVDTGSNGLSSGGSGRRGCRE
jgi:hypothetical protein